jgi:hypothetical protein
MSEYQYYEFQAIDRPLNTKEQSELRAYSTRARITPTSFINDYSWGNFKGNPNAWMEKYFDAFLYLANWGTRELQLRLPSSLLPIETARAYCYTDCASVREKNGKIILSFVSEEEPEGEWEEGESWLSSIIPVRAELARGDYRCLYLAWLLSVQQGELDEEEEEPPVPEGLGEISGSLVSFADFLRIDQDLLHAALQTSLPLHLARPNQEDVLVYVRMLSAEEKDGLLLRLMMGEEAHFGAEMLNRFLKEKRKNPSLSLKHQRRTVGELIRAGDEYREERRRAAAKKAAEEKARREAEKAARREKHLDTIASRETETWLRVDDLIATKQPGRYDEAISLLIDLRDVANRKGKTKEFMAQVTLLRKQHEKKPSFLKRLEKAGL